MTHSHGGSKDRGRPQPTLGPVHAACHTGIWGPGLAAVTMWPVSSDQAGEAPGSSLKVSREGLVGINTGQRLWLQIPWAGLQF